MLPLHQGYIDLAPGLGIEPRLTESKSVVLPLHNPGINLVPQTGLEPVTHEFSIRCSTIGAIVAKLALEVTVEGDVTNHWLGCARPRLTQG
jgi:hypothetical protein